MGEIVENVFENQLYYKNTVVLKYTIKYPQLVRSRYRYGAQRFNQYNDKKAVKLAKYAETELFEEAKTLYDYNTSKGFPVMVYEVFFDYEVTYQNNAVVSLYTDEYIFSGGAHGNTKREAQNWNLQNGRQILLKDLFPENPYFVLDILKEINNQIAQQMENGENDYFENYCQLVLENFSPENFYMVPEGIVIFFNQYEIAPYSSGIPTFLVKTIDKK